MSTDRDLYDDLPKVRICDCGHPKGWHVRDMSSEGGPPQGCVASIPDYYTGVRSGQPCPCRRTWNDDADQLELDW